MCAGITRSLPVTVVRTEVRRLLRGRSTYLAPSLDESVDVTSGSLEFSGVRIPTWDSRRFGSLNRVIVRPSCSVSVTSILSSSVPHLLTDPWSTAST